MKILSDPELALPSIPNYLKDPTIFEDKRLGIVMVADWPDLNKPPGHIPAQPNYWVFRLHNDHWCSERKAIYPTTWTPPQTKYAPAPAPGEPDALFKTVTDHKYISEVCHEKGCQYLVLTNASQPPGDLSEVVRLLTELRTYYMQRDDPNGANWCEKVITEAKELEKL